MDVLPGPKYSKEQKDRFFDLIDRGGTVRAAAEAVGVHPEAAYTWLRQSGLTMRRATPRIYSEEEKAEFFRLLTYTPLAYNRWRYERLRAKYRAMGLESFAPTALLSAEQQQGRTRRPCEGAT